MQRPLQRPNRLTSRLYAYRHAALFLIFLLIVQLFNVLEQTVVPRFWVECSLDQYIPFIPVFVVPYVFWFLYVGVGLVFLCLWDKETFVPTIFLLCAGMAIALLIYAVFPHGQPLRPAVTGTDPFSVFIRDVIYANDTNTNCCPYPCLKPAGRTRGDLPQPPPPKPAGNQGRVLGCHGVGLRLDDAD